MSFSRHIELSSVNGWGPRGSGGGWPQRRPNERVRCSALGEGDEREEGDGEFVGHQSPLPFAFSPCGLPSLCPCELEFKHRAHTHTHTHTHTQTHTDTSLQYTGRRANYLQKCICVQANTHAHTHTRRQSHVHGVPFGAQWTNKSRPHTERSSIMWATNQKTTLDN